MKQLNRAGRAQEKHGRKFTDLIDSHAPQRSFGAEKSRRNFDQ
jgi:hypothetical protein